MADLPIANANNQELSPCPHCSANARVQPDERFRFVCAACGAPRVPVSDASVHSQAEYDFLKQAQALTGQARLVRVGATFAALGATAFGFFAVVAGAAIHGAVALPLVLLGISLGLAVMTIAFGANARKKIDDAKAAVSSAWEQVAEALMRKHGRSMTALDLAALMQTNEGEAERILTLLSVDDRVQATVTDEAQIRYTVPTQLRVDVDNPMSNRTNDAAALQEQEQRATAETVMAPIPKVEK